MGQDEHDGKPGAAPPRRTGVWRGIVGEQPGDIEADIVRNDVAQRLFGGEKSPTIVGGRYEIVRALGAGGMADVYEARQLDQSRRVAVKMLKPELAAAPRNVQRFLREARAASRIEHRNVVEIVDCGELPGGGAYLVMEYLEGTDLQRLVDRGGLPWSVAVRIFRQIAVAIRAAHALGIIHRDIKPSNCFLIPLGDGSARDFHVKVLDFGVAKLPDGDKMTGGPLTATGAVVGSIHFIAPELAAGAPADVRSDIYAFGVLAFNVLTGRLPFEGGTPFVVLDRACSMPPPSPRSLAPEIPIAAEAMILRALAKDPALRFQSMQEVVDVLHSIPANAR